MSLIGSVIMYFASLEIWVSKDKKKNVVALFILGSMTHTLFCAAWTSLEPLFFIFFKCHYLFNFSQKPEKTSLDYMSK